MSSYNMIVSSKPDYITDIFTCILRNESSDSYELILEQLTNISKTIAFKYFNLLESPYLVESAQMTLGVLNYAIYLKKFKTETLAKQIAENPSYLREIFKEGISEIKKTMELVHDDINDPNLKDYLTDMELLPGRQWLGLSSLQERQRMRIEKNIDYKIFLSNSIYKQYFAVDSVFSEGLLEIYAKYFIIGLHYLLISDSEKNKKAKDIKLNNFKVPLSDYKIVKALKEFFKSDRKDGVYKILCNNLDPKNLKHIKNIVNDCFNLSKLDALSTVKMFNIVEDAEFFENTIPQELLQIYKETSTEDAIQHSCVICLECGKKLKSITSSHLKKHSLSLSEYKKKYNYSPKAKLSITKSKGYCKAISKGDLKKRLLQK